MREGLQSKRRIESSMASSRQSGRLTALPFRTITGLTAQKSARVNAETIAAIPGHARPTSSVAHDCGLRDGNRKALTRLISWACTLLHDFPEL